MKSKTLFLSLTLSLVLTIVLFGVALAAGVRDPTSPDCDNRIYVKKVTEPAGGQDFSFTLLKNGNAYYTFPPIDDQEQKYKETDSWAIFTLTEAAKEGYQLKNISCTGPTGTLFTYDLANKKVTIDLDTNNINGSIYCTFTNVQQMDFGDLPESYGMTSFAQNGARHYPGSLYLGSSIDAEWDGQPDSGATGDDTNGSGDEDGVARLGQWGADPSGKGTLRFTVAGSNGCLSGWLDYANQSSGDLSADGKFSTFTHNSILYDEYIIQNVYVPSGTNDILFDLPTDFGNLVAFGRFRLFSLEEGGCTHPTMPTGGDFSSAVSVVPGYFGFANNGEVEDYSWLFGPSAVTLQSFEGVAANSSLGALLVILLSAAVLGLLWRILRRAQG